MASQPRRLDDQGVRVPGKLVPRLVARVVDSLIVAAVGAPLGFATDFGFTWLTLQAVLVFAYFVVLDVTWQTTVGKRLLGLRVVGAGGGPPSVPEAAVREAFTLLGAIPYAGGPLALIAWVVIAVTINSSATGQGKHDDLAGGTQVVAA